MLFVEKKITPCGCGPPAAVTRFQRVAGYTGLPASAQCRHRRRWHGPAKGSAYFLFSCIRGRFLFVRPLAAGDFDLHRFDPGPRSVDCLLFGILYTLPLTEA